MQETWEKSDRHKRIRTSVKDGITRIQKSLIWAGREEYSQREPEYKRHKEDHSQREAEMCVADRGVGMPDDGHKQCSTDAVVQDRVLSLWPSLKLLVFAHFILSEAMWRVTDTSSLSEELAAAFGFIKFSISGLNWDGFGKLKPHQNLNLFFLCLDKERGLHVYFSCTSYVESSPITTSITQWS